MELGNIIFGNSRGEFPVSRSAGYYGELIRLFEAYAPDRVNLWREYGEEFENDVFSVFPYYWGEDLCGYEEKEEAWFKTNRHEKHCYQTALRKAQREWLANNPEPEAQMMNVSQEEIEPGMVLIMSEPAYSPSADMWREWSKKRRVAHSQIYDKLCAAFELDREFGCAAHCTCGFEERWAAFCEENYHDPQCPIVKPNFLHKPSGFSISWYKYPMRSSFMNENLSVQEFAKIIDSCIESLA